MTAFEERVVAALESLPHSGHAPMHLGIFHWMRGVLIELPPENRPEPIVEAFRTLHHKFFPSDKCPV